MDLGLSILIGESTLNFNAIKMNLYIENMGKYYTLTYLHPRPH